MTQNTQPSFRIPVYYSLRPVLYEGREYKVNYTTLRNGEQWVRLHGIDKFVRAMEITPVEVSSGLSPMLKP